jgi:hypothetical protein
VEPQESACDKKEKEEDGDEKMGEESPLEPPPDGGTKTTEDNRPFGLVSRIIVTEDMLTKQWYYAGLPISPADLGVVDLTVPGRELIKSWTVQLGPFDDMPKLLLSRVFRKRYFHDPAVMGGRTLSEYVQLTTPEQRGAFFRSQAALLQLGGVDAHPILRVGVEDTGQVILHGSWPKLIDAARVVREKTVQDEEYLPPELKSGVLSSTGQKVLVYVMEHDMPEREDPEDMLGLFERNAETGKEDYVRGACLSLRRMSAEIVEEWGGDENKDGGSVALECFKRMTPNTLYMDMEKGRTVEPPRKTNNHLESVMERERQPFVEQYFIRVRIVEKVDPTRDNFEDTEIICIRFFGYS